MNPKVFQAVTLIACMVLSAVCSPGVAAAIKQISIDEYGHMLIQYQNPQANPDVLITGVLAPDTGLPGSKGMALTYTLPFTPSVGDVLMREKQSNSTISDVLRFVPAGLVNGVNANRLLFYSDNSDTDLDPGLADTGLPGEFLSILGTNKKGDPIPISPMVQQEDASENGLESKAVWTPSDNNGATDPGYFTNDGQPFKYVFYSEGNLGGGDGVGIPEPTALAVLAVGAMGAVFARRRRV